MAHADIIPQEL